MLKSEYIVAGDLPDSWHQAVFRLLEVGTTYTIERGSYQGSKRLEFDYVTIHIKYPHVRPLTPQLGKDLGIPNPVEDGYVEDYLPYLMTPKRKEGEQYTYGERIAGHLSLTTRVRGTMLADSIKAAQPRDLPVYLHEIDQIEYFIEVLKRTPNTNQAILQVAQPGDSLLDDPPCLRHIDLRIKNGELVFFPYFRSWDLWNGLPANLAAVVLLQEYMAVEIGVKPGPMVCASKGLHLYPYTWELAAMLRGKPLEEFPFMAGLENYKTYSEHSIEAENGSLYPLKEVAP